MAIQHGVVRDTVGVVPVREAANLAENFAANSSSLLSLATNWPSKYLIYRWVRTCDLLIRKRGMPVAL